IKNLEQDILRPSALDEKQAKLDDFQVFRLLPREKYGQLLTVQGGGSYYSFTSRSNDYQKTAQIGLEQNNLNVGFAGADYGFIFDLGDISLAYVTKDSVEARFLVAYKAPMTEKDVRSEAMKTYNYEANGFTYKSRIPATVGHVYLLRAISFERADVLVAFKVF